jgi:hypothetical protein
VEHGDGSVVTRCVAFSADTISGEELLNQSGVAWSSQAFGGFGDAVCALDGEPAHYVDCLGKDNSWALFVSRRGGPWQLSSVGISSLKLGDGDAEGFRYVPDAGIAAPPVSASGICPTAATATGSPAAFTPTATAASVASFVATATINDSPRPPVPNPAPPGGPDPGLMLAVGVGSGLAGLAILRLVLARRPGL